MLIILWILTYNCELVIFLVMNGVIKTSNGVDIDGVGSLAGLVEEDIQRRGLMPGDRYLYAKDVAKLFGV